jgi:hypothetical protein
MLALVPGATVWSAIVLGCVAWVAALFAFRGRIVGPARVARWMLGSWFSRLAVFVVWGGIGWHMFCQRP